MARDYAIYVRKSDSPDEYERIMQVRDEMRYPFEFRKLAEEKYGTKAIVLEHRDGYEPPRLICGPQLHGDSPYIGEGQWASAEWGERTQSIQGHGI